MTGWNIAKRAPAGAAEPIWLPCPGGACPLYPSYESAVSACNAINIAEAGGGPVSYAASVALELLGKVVEHGGQVQLGPLDLFDQRLRGLAAEPSGTLECLILWNDWQTLGGLRFQGLAQPEGEKPADLSQAISRALYALETRAVQKVPSWGAVPPPCALCKKPAGPDDFCAGCQSWVCVACEHPDPDKRPRGRGHDVAAHRRILS